MRIVLSLLLLPFKILKFIAIITRSALKIFIFFALCALILNYVANTANTANTGVKDVHSFQKGPGTERNHTARC